MSQTKKIVHKVVKFTGKTRNELKRMKNWFCDIFFWVVVDFLFKIHRKLTNFGYKTDHISKTKNRKIDFSSFLHILHLSHKYYHFKFFLSKNILPIWLKKKSGGHEVMKNYNSCNCVATINHIMHVCLQSIINLDPVNMCFIVRC